MAFWRGNGVNVLKVAPETALKFLIFDQAKRRISELRGHTSISMSDRFLGAASAGAISQTIVYPLEVVKVRFSLTRFWPFDPSFLSFPAIRSIARFHVQTRLTAATKGQYRGLWHCASKLVQTNGLRAFYRGYLRPGVDFGRVIAHNCSCCFLRKGSPPI
eukprot:m.324671 g.324671  ORF g.324671 m.324671 type:complete len:160 (-) comp55541_c0_seq5:391-870(-)